MPTKQHSESRPRAAAYLLDSEKRTRVPNIRRHLAVLSCDLSRQQVLLGDSLGVVSDSKVSREPTAEKRPRLGDLFGFSFATVKAANRRKRPPLGAHPKTADSDVQRPREDGMDDTSTSSFVTRMWIVEQMMRVAHADISSSLRLLYNDRRPRQLTPSRAARDWPFRELFERVALDGF
ncbi:hypothetical protein FI667_g7258, partial [Globisporangium splendens]